jgi:hypothetical protein
LARLYAAYSEGVHALSDDECQQVAMELRDSLDYLLPGLTEQLGAARRYSNSLAKAQRRKAKTPTT